MSWFMIFPCLVSSMRELREICDKSESPMLPWDSIIVSQYNICTCVRLTLSPGAIHTHTYRSLQWGGRGSLSLSCVLGVGTAPIYPPVLESFRMLQCTVECKYVDFAGALRTVFYDIRTILSDHPTNRPRVEKEEQNCEIRRYSAAEVVHSFTLSQDTMTSTSLI